MVALEVVRASNAQVRNLPSGLVAVFAGATSGIGESTLKQWCRETRKSRVYFVGRSKDAADRIHSELKTIQPDTEARFIQKDLTLLKNVDEVCEEIKAKESKLNLLFMTPGTMSFKGRDETSEGLDRKLTTNYYARMRFTQQLLPLLQNASPELSRVVSVLSPGSESPGYFNLDDLDLKHSFSVRKAACHAVTMTDFSFEELAKQNPNVSFVHTFPGLIKTGFAKEASFIVKAASNLALSLGSLWTVGIQESGERHLHAATNAMYSPKSGGMGAVESDKTTIMKGSNGEIGSGAYLIGWDGEFRANEKMLTKLRHEGAGAAIWQHTLDLFASVRS